MEYSSATENLFRISLCFLGSINYKNTFAKLYLTCSALKLLSSKTWASMALILEICSRSAFRLCAVPLSESVTEVDWRVSDYINEFKNVQDPAEVEPARKPLYREAVPASIPHGGAPSKLAHQAASRLQQNSQAADAERLANSIFTGV